MKKIIIAGCLTAFSYLCLCANDGDSNYYRTTPEYKRLAPDEQEKVNRVIADLNQVEQAMTKYRNENQRFAPTLEALVPKYLNKVPLDPFSTTATRAMSPKELKVNPHTRPTLNGYGYYFFSDPENAWLIVSAGGREITNAPSNYGLYRAGGFWSGGTYAVSVKEPVAVRDGRTSVSAEETGLRR